MATYMPLRTHYEQSFHRVNAFDEQLNGNDFAFLDKNVLLYRDKNGEYVVLTIKNKATYTVDDYMALPEGAPFELLNGKLTYMPSPKDPHQNASGNLFGSLLFHVKSHKLGIVRHAPLDVHLNNTNIVQPDILFLSNDRKDRRKDWIYGAPDLMVEIISKGTEKKDRKTKFWLYEQHGVLEYWLVDTKQRSVEVYVSTHGKFAPKILFKEGDTLVASIVPGFSIPVAAIFESDE